MYIGSISVVREYLWWSIEKLNIIWSHCGSEIDYAESSVVVDAWSGNAWRNSKAARQALEGDVDLKAASEVICSRTPSQIRQFKQIYFSNFSVGLEDDIASEASGEQQKASPAYT